MRVITLNAETFAGEVSHLASLVGSDGFVPDILIGIQTGGVYVARDMMQIFGGAMLATVSLHRKSTPVKNVVLPLLLRILPRKFFDYMRMLESRLSRRDRSVELYDFTLPEELRNLCDKRILIVDDAVDRGKTLATVVKAVRENTDNCDIRSAVITVTQPLPIISPDYCLYNDNTLIRFPWAPDVKK